MAYYVGLNKYLDAAAELGRNPVKVSTRVSLSMKRSRLTRDGTAKPVSGDQILRCERGQRNVHFPRSADHLQDWQPYPVDPYTCYICVAIDTYPGRVFPAGVGPGSPSRDAANLLSSRFGLSVKMRRRYGWLRMVFSGVRPVRPPIWCNSGGWRHARGKEHCHEESGSAPSGGYAPDSAKAEGSSIVDEPGEG